MMSQSLTQQSDSHVAQQTICNIIKRRTWKSV
jgi:hypothetical protein